MPRPFNSSHSAHPGGGSGGRVDRALLKARGLGPLPALLPLPSSGPAPIAAVPAPSPPRPLGPQPRNPPRGRDRPPQTACGGQGPASGLRLHPVPFEPRETGPRPARAFQPAHLLRRGAPAVFTQLAERPPDPAPAQTPPPARPGPAPAPSATLRSRVHVGAPTGGAALERQGAREGPGLPLCAAGTPEWT